MSGAHNHKARAEKAEAVVAMLQEFTRRERAIFEAKGKGGMSVGEHPTVTPSVLRELERMLTHAPDVQGNYDALQQRAERAEAMLEEQQKLANIYGKGIAGWRPIVERVTTAEAAYHEAQITIASLEAERDHYRTALAGMTAKRDALFEEATAKGRELAEVRDAYRAHRETHFKAVATLRNLRTYLHTADLEPSTCGDVLTWLDAREG